MSLVQAWQLGPAQGDEEAEEETEEEGQETGAANAELIQLSMLAGPLLGDALRDEFKRTSVSGFDEILMRTSRELLGTALAEFQDNGPLDEELLVALAQSLGDTPRFLVLVRVESDEIQHSSGSSSSRDDGGLTETLRTSRELSASISIFNLEARRLAMQIDLSDIRWEAGETEEIELTTT